MKRLTVLLGAIALAMSVPCMAQAAEEKPAGTVALTVSLPDPGQKILYVDEVMPVEPGALTLYYPKWIPGDHSPDGPIENIMGLTFTAGGKAIAWQRDELDRFAFHLTVPVGVREIDIRFQFPSRDRVTRNLLDLTWNHVALYRADRPTRMQTYLPALVVPADWKYASALETAKRDGARIVFKPVPFDTLVDSPVIAGQHFREIDVTPPGSSVRRWLDLVGDDAAAIAISDEQVAAFRRLIEQAQALFHSHHYGSYHLLLTLSDHTSVGGLEHHQSSDDRARSGSKMLADAGHFMLDASLLPHEYTHSWNGKFMRPAGLWQPDFEQPEKPKLLWVYEGLTVYLGDVLTARSGLWSADTWREVLAYRAAEMAHRTGRAWRPLIDTTVAVDYGAPAAWSNWRRENDFYREGQLLWLAVDMKIRELSRDGRCIDDFARAFFGVDDGSFVTHTYDFDDVVAALTKVQPYDWVAFLRNWVNGTGEQVPLLSGIEAAGWRLVYTDKPSGYESALENVGKGELEGRGINEMFSLGLFLDGDGKVVDVAWDGPAFKAGLAPGMKLVSVDGHAYTAQALRDAITGAQQSRQPLQIRAQQDGAEELHAVRYDGGLKYPHLVRRQGATDRLESLLAAKPVREGRSD
ncbi:MAG: M61 family peptidase [Rudaea sp.]|uniref:M61 family metallopeptidase n=1 Tax=Rudaea sp. TaxID=2136325 RepID=UPI0039E6B189